jgi:outer membrane biosynthesis protein TonB
MSDRKKIIIAIVGSLILHVIIILGSSRVVALWPDLSPSEHKEDETPPQMTMLDTPAPTPPPTEQKQQPQYLRTNDDQKTDQKPVDSMFESDKDTAAASENPAKGDAPLPTQEGKDTPDLGFKNEDFSLADRGQSFSRDPGRQAPPQQKEEKQEEKPVETPTPEATPTPTPEVTPTPAPTPEVTPTPAPTPEATPTPAPTPEATPPPKATPKPDVVPSDDEMAMLFATPTPIPTPMPTPVRRAQAVPQRQSAPATAYRPMQRMPRMQGNINNRGRSSIAALGTPQGRFRKAVEDAVGSRWYYYMRDKRDLVNFGSVRISFEVRSDGKVEGVKVISNSSNETLASLSLQSIIDANLPPMPEDLAPMLAGDPMEFTLTFTFTSE